MRRHVRAVPWLLALLGLAVPLVGSGFVVWQIVAIWLAFLGFAWLFGRHLLRSRGERIVTALVALPILLLPLAGQGGWWLIPADLAWLAIEVLDRPREPAAPTIPRPSPCCGDLPAGPGDDPGGRQAALGHSSHADVEHVWARPGAAAAAGGAGDGSRTRG